MEPKRLYRSQTDRKFAGVAGGLADYFVMDPLLIRLAFVVLTLAGGGGFLIYIILWIVTPENPLRIKPVMNQPGSDFQQPNSGNTGYATDASGYTTDAPKADAFNPVSTPAPQTMERNKGSLIGGMVLITLGALFLADELIPQINFGDLWPVILIVVGIGLLINTMSKKKINTNEH
jgi:phage shock protein PspC (stress-responsive transcriptional regulator)